MIARCTPWGTIQIGAEFYKLPPVEQQAILAHEEGHLHHKHHLKRLSWFLTLRVFFRPQKFFEMCEAQELEADKYAVRRGHGIGLVAYLCRYSMHVKSPGYPTHKQRIEAIHG